MPSRTAGPHADLVAARPQQLIVPAPRDAVVARGPTGGPIAPVPLRRDAPGPDRRTARRPAAAPTTDRTVVTDPAAASDPTVTTASRAPDAGTGRSPVPDATAGDSASGRSAEAARRAPLTGRNVLAGRAVVVAWAMAVGTGLVSVVFAATLVALELFARASSDGAQAAFDRWERIDGMAAGAFFASTVPWLAAFTVLAAWTYVESRSPPDGVPTARWAGAWTIALWFVPVANLLVPRLVMAELERRRTPGAPLWVGGHLWWFAWLAGGASLLGGLVLSDTDDIGTLRTSYGLLVVGFALLAAGWALLGVLVRRIDRAIPEHRAEAADAGSMACAHGPPAVATARGGRPGSGGGAG